MSDQASNMYTAAQVQALDRIAIEQYGIPGYDLMQRAAGSLATHIQHYCPHLHSCSIFCGGGNNGGDGYVLARLLKEAGIQVTVYGLKSVDQLQGDAATAAQDWLQAGGSVTNWQEGTMIEADLVVDALLGTGLDRPLKAPYLQAVQAINQIQCPVVAVDIPSGLSSDTGTALGSAIKADMTVSFIGMKRGLYTGDGPDYAGVCLFDDLQVPVEVYQQLDQQPVGQLLKKSLLPELLRPRRKNSHKGSFGHVLAIGGGPGMSGAVRLCGEASLRSGAGLVTVATHKQHAALINMTRPELMVQSVGGDLNEVAVHKDVIAIGPGLGRDDWARALFDSCLKLEQPIVMDADALNLLAEQGGQASQGQRVLTPHPGEAARLAGVTISDIQSDRVNWASRLAEQYHSIVVLKGCGTVIADARGNYAISPLGNPGMSTAGVGDVLTGVIAALIAQSDNMGLDLWTAVLLAVLVHGDAGDQASMVVGERGLIASDLIQQLPKVLNPGVQASNT